MPRLKRTRNTPPARQSPETPRDQIIATLAELEADIITQDKACQTLRLAPEQIVQMLDADPGLEQAVAERAGALMLDPSVAHAASTKALNQAALILQRKIETDGANLLSNELASLMGVADKISQASTARAAEIKAEHTESAVESRPVMCGGFHVRRLPNGQAVGLFFRMDPDEIHLWSDYGRLLAAAGTLTLEERQDLFERFIRSWYRWNGGDDLRSVCEMAKLKPGINVEFICMGTVDDLETLDHLPVGTRP